MLTDVSKYPRDKRTLGQDCDFDNSAVRSPIEFTARADHRPNQSAAGHMTKPERAPARTPLDPFLRRIGNVGLHEYEVSLIHELVGGPGWQPAGIRLRRGTEALSRPLIVASGWGCYFRVLPEGRKPILSVIIPGDTIGFCDGPYDSSGCDVAALTDLHLIDAGDLKAVVQSGERQAPNLKIAIELECALQGARLLDHVLRLGYLTAIERMAHFLLEIHHRLRTVELVSEGTFELPLTQLQLGDALGLSLVHVNRTLQQFRQSGVVSINHSIVTTHDIERLQQMAAL